MWKGNKLESRYCTYMHTGTVLSHIPGTCRKNTYVHAVGFEDLERCASAGEFGYLTLDKAHNLLLKINWGVTSVVDPDPEFFASADTDPG
jgi:hypothetical protein